jgi:hypothetical protein
MPHQLSIFENINKMLHGSAMPEAITGTGRFAASCSSIQWQNPVLFHRDSLK